MKFDSQNETIEVRKKKKMNWKINMFPVFTKAELIRVDATVL